MKRIPLLSNIDYTAPYVDPRETFTITEKDLPMARHFTVHMPPRRSVEIGGYVTVTGIDKGAGTITCEPAWADSVPRTRSLLL